uniref:BTB domain-containing protein n=1 Tax=Gouania willdenowi TaxID=441366 RepID=A0A8C5HJY7_GOUWI
KDPCPLPNTSTESFDPVSLNVGGDIYTTTLDTLTRCRDSMLGAMFTGQIPVLRDKRGNVFIDRDGKVFRYILNFLRTSCLDLPDEFSELALLRREADFFQIRPLLEEIRCYESTLLLSLSFQVRVLHFNLRHGPENYELRTCSIQTFTVDFFCTWRAFLALLCERFSYMTSQGLISPHPSNPRQNRLRLEWVPRPDQLPPDQYNKQRYQGLMVCYPQNGSGNMQQSACEITDMQSFVEELLRMCLAEGFRVDQVSPNSVELLNCTALRLVKN